MAAHSNAAELENMRAAHMDAERRLDAAATLLAQRMRTDYERRILKLLVDARADLERAKGYMMLIHPNGREG